MAKEYTDILFPPGRYIIGDLFTGSDKDSKGVQRLIKRGPNAGKPFIQWFIGVAIPKGGEQHWAHTEWGQKVYAVAAKAYPAFVQNPAFSWKIEDGDSAIPNKNNRRPCDMEGAPGHWVVKFSTGVCPEVWAQPTAGNFQRLEPGSIKRGDWVQVFGSVAGNDGETPGVYVGHNKVLFVRPDAEIKSGLDAATAFAGAVVSQGMPAGSAVPFAAPGLPAMPVPTAAAPALAVPTAAAPALAVPPNPAFLAGPGAPALPAAPAVPVAAAVPPAAPAVPALPPQPQMTPAGIASGFTLQQYRDKGWTDEALRANGIIF